MPLSGVRVLDVATAVAAPVAATLMGDFGAEVIKVEEPRHGDALMRSGGDADGGRSLYWIQESRNKKSVTVDLRRPEGQDVLRRLVAGTDVFMTNYRPTTLDKWGLGPEDLAAVNPEAILLFLSGYGLTGPYRDRGSFDRIAGAFSGLTYVTGDPSMPPMRPGFSVNDYMSAYLSAFAVMAALRHREVNGGGGQVVDLALYEAPFRAAEHALLNYAVNDAVRERQGAKNPFFVPAMDCETKDGRQVAFHAGTDSLFRRLAAVMGNPALAEDPRFSTLSARVEHQDELYEVVREWFASRSGDEAVDLLSAAGIPASPIMNIADIAHDKHYRGRGTIVDVDDPDFGTVPMVAPLPHLSGTPGTIRSLGPRLGEHTREVLCDVVGMSQDEFDDLQARGIVGQDPGREGPSR